ncbi:HAD family hydrolase [Paenibacillus hunanensis]|uniref:Beta-phosphoglucomutase n=1 Tax=Paenibacillus hunanensis TaxID=539262 RepID=A0ABU1ITJ7_9BACL|nr:HAD family phosphatase [Paenibacillus hunanensis]MDR6242548.1 beta-phosphoglucomutase [Paenibacillus hunanensis]GGJ00884.1 haloacid dehalogenase [Paenibacillus hunanensis]
MSKKLAIFDLDGTLFDTREVNYLSYKHALANQGFDLDYNFYTEQCNGKYYKEYLPLIIPNITEEMMEDIHHDKKNAYFNNLGVSKVNEHLFNIISNLKTDYHIALVTTASKTNCMDILNYFSKTNEFELIITHNDVEKVKPDPEGFFKAMSYYNMSAENTIIFEDSEIGIEAAIRTGATVFTITKF